MSVSTIMPSDIDTSRHFFNAFDNMETETSAKWVVRFCQGKGGWVDFTGEEIEAFYNKDGFCDFQFNRLVSAARVVPQGHGARAFSAGIYYDGPWEERGGGWIALDRDGKYHITNSFIERCYQAAPKPKED